MKKSKTFSTLISTLVVVVALLCTPLPGAAQQPTTLVCDIWPPYQMNRGDELIGFSTEMVKGVYASLGVSTPQITSLPWKRALATLAQDHADGLFSANYIREREFFATYPEEPLFEAPWIIWTRSGHKVTSLHDLKGKRVGVVIGYSYTTEFWNFIETNCDVQKVSKDENNFRKLALGRLDATIAEYGNGLFLKKKYGLETVIPNPEVEIKRDGLYMAFNKKRVSDSFVGEFSEALKQFKTTERYTDLWIKYFGTEPPK